MSASVARTSRSSGGAVQATRQQLDELDALLQRMLDLPVNPVEEPEPAPSPRESAYPAHELPPAFPEQLTHAARTARPAQPRPAGVPRSDSEVAGGLANLRAHLSTCSETHEPAVSDVVPPPLAREPGSSPRPAPSRSYPASYMVVETSTPPFLDPGAQPRGAGGPHPNQVEEPVPGGRHDLVEDRPPTEEELAAMQGGPTGDWVPLRSSWQPSAQTWKPLAETWEQARVPTAEPPQEYPGEGPVVVTRSLPVQEPRPPVVPMPPPPPGWNATASSASWNRLDVEAPPPGPLPRVGTHPPQPPVSPAPMLPTLAPPPAASYPAALWPVVWFNQAFDLLLVPFGPPGRWLRGRAGRGILGTVGLVCLAAAVAVVAADGFGWTR